MPALNHNTPLPPEPSHLEKKSECNQQCLEFRINNITFKQERIKKELKKIENQLTDILSSKQIDKEKYNNLKDKIDKIYEKVNNMEIIEYILAAEWGLLLLLTIMALYRITRLENFNYFSERSFKNKNKKW